MAKDSPNTLKDTHSGPTERDRLSLPMSPQLSGIGPYFQTLEGSGLWKEEKSIPTHSEPKRGEFRADTRVWPALCIGRNGKIDGLCLSGNMAVCAADQDKLFVQLTKNSYRQ